PRYGLDLHIDEAQGHRLFEHGGEISGFVSENLVFPDDKAALVVLTSGTAAGDLAHKIASLLLAGDPTEVAAATARARDVLVGLQHGKLDRDLFTANANAFFDAAVLADFTASLAPLGAPL